MYLKVGLSFFSGRLHCSDCTSTNGLSAQFQEEVKKSIIQLAVEDEFFVAVTENGGGPSGANTFYKTSFHFYFFLFFILSNSSRNDFSPSAFLLLLLIFGKDKSEKERDTTGHTHTQHLEGSRL